MPAGLAAAALQSGTLAAIETVVPGFGLAFEAVEFLDKDSTGGPIARQRLVLGCGMSPKDYARLGHYVRSRVPAPEDGRVMLAIAEANECPATRGKWTPAMHRADELADHAGAIVTLSPGHSRRLHVAQLLTLLGVLEGTPYRNWGPVHLVKLITERDADAIKAAILSG